MVTRPKKSYAQSEGYIPAGLTAGDYLERAVSTVPKKPAIIFDGERITYHQLDNLVNQLAASLLRLGVRRGDRVCLLLPNCLEFIVASQAILKIGAVKVPLHINFRQTEIETTLRHSKSRAIIMVSNYDNFSFTDLITEIRTRLPALEQIIVKGITKAQMIPLRQLINGDSGAKEFVERYVYDRQLDADDVAAIVYTSGTTGIPKGVVHTHNTIYRLAVSSNIMREVRKNEIWLGMLPLSSAFGVEYVEPCPIVSATTLVLLERYLPEPALESIQKHKVTSPVGAPTLFHGMLKHPNFFDYDVSTVRNIYLGGSSASVEMLMDLKNKFKCSLSITYGSAECGHATMTSLNDPPEIVYKTCGKPIYGGVEIKIVGDNRQIVPCREIGEIYVRSFGNSLGYYEDPDSTGDFFDHSRWVHVNDLGVMNEEGYVTIVGRNNDMIIRGGYNIYPDQIESLLYSHEKVAAVCIVGYSDQELGEKTCAFILPKDGVSEITREEIVSFLAKKIAEYKIPDLVKVVDSFPTTASGKIQRYKLRERIIGEIWGNNGITGQYGRDDRI